MGQLGQVPRVFPAGSQHYPLGQAIYPDSPEAISGLVEVEFEVWGRVHWPHGAQYTPVKDLESVRLWWYPVQPVLEG